MRHNFLSRVCLSKEDRMTNQTRHVLLVMDFSLRWETWSFSLFLFLPWTLFCLLFSVPTSLTLFFSTLSIFVKRHERENDRQEGERESKSGNWCGGSGFMQFMSCCRNSSWFPSLFCLSIRDKRCNCRLMTTVFPVVNFTLQTLYFCSHQRRGKDMETQYRVLVRVKEIQDTLFCHLKQETN